MSPFAVLLSVVGAVLWFAEPRATIWAKPRPAASADGRGQPCLDIQNLV
ncbi:hypothetical protein RC1_2424 [Rhodospirillum centenum SW]|uniref:Uncharacterized protein n=1 Tax=Rhodospirillum centenum (strain ATCC 51521 / SW) TaxID=414684 RepID=B6IUI3_RHOCS|nr:hypothetical protein RC1_2424 [Rhodospirillum centenum SW]